MNTIGAITGSQVAQIQSQSIPSTIAVTSSKDSFEPVFKAIETQMQARSDLGQKLQFQLNEANSIYNRSVQAKSNIASTHNKTADALVQNIRG